MIVEYNIAKENTGVADSDFLQKCMLDVVEQKVDLLILTYSGKWRSAEYIEDKKHNLLQQLMQKCEYIDWYIFPHAG